MVAAQKTTFFEPFLSKQNEHEDPTTVDEDTYADATESAPTAKEGYGEPGFPVAKPTAKPKPTKRVGNLEVDADVYFAIKGHMKPKIKSKLAAKWSHHQEPVAVPTPQPTPRDLVKETAKDRLKSHLSEEALRMGVKKYV